VILKDVTFTLDIVACSVLYDESHFQNISVEHYMLSH